MKSARPATVAAGEGDWGFEHNLQSLRVVDELEERYPDFDGLNLTFETREGILKHCSRANAERLLARDDSGVARRFVHGGSPSLEAQLCNLADEIAYNAHDIDDGVRSGLLQFDQLAEVPLFWRYREQAVAAHPGLKGRRLLFESIRLMLSDQVYDVIDTTRERIRASGVQSPDEVRSLKSPLVAFSARNAGAVTCAQRLPAAQLYRHPQVMETTTRAAQVVSELFGCYLDRPDELPPGQGRGQEPAREVADYIAGMTDRFAIREHQRLCGTVLFP